MEFLILGFQDPCKPGALDSLGLIRPGPIKIRTAPAQHCHQPHKTPKKKRNPIKLKPFQHNNDTNLIHASKTAKQKKTVFSKMFVFAGRGFKPEPGNPCEKGS